MRGSRPRKPTSNAFLDAAKKQAEANEAERLVTTEDAAREAYDRRKADFFARNVLPLAEQLQSLPEKDGRKFKLHDRTYSDVMYVSYTGGAQGVRGGRRSYKPLRDEVGIILRSYRDDDDFEATVLHFNRHAPGGHSAFLSVRVNTVADLQAELGKWVGGVAPDRLGELASKETPKASPKKPGSRR